MILCATYNYHPFSHHYSHQPKSVADAIQEIQEKNIDAFLGLTDSIIGIIKCFPISEQEPTTPVERLAHRSLATVSIVITSYYCQYRNNCLY